MTINCPYTILCCFTFKNVYTLNEKLNVNIFK